MRSYLSLIPISAKVHRRQNRMTLLCIIFAVFLVTAGVVLFNAIYSTLSLRRPAADTSHSVN